MPVKCNSVVGFHAQGENKVPYVYLPGTDLIGSVQMSDLHFSSPDNSCSFWKWLVWFAETNVLLAS